MAQVELGRALGMLAGLLIFLVGLFILKAKPLSGLHRLFCAFAITDGISTFAFDLSLVPSGLPVQLHAYLVYFHSFIAFVALLVCFGLLFPRPAIPPAWRLPAVLAVGGMALVAIVWHALDPYVFWVGRPQPDGSILFSYGPGGRIIVAVWLCATAGVILRLMFLLRFEPSPSHRRQAAFVLGGIALAYAPYATTTLVGALRAGLVASFVGQPLSVALVYLASALIVLAIAVAAASFAFDHRAETHDERRVVLACFSGVAVLTGVSILFPGRVGSDVLQTIGLVAYPLLLAYAIARYEILDIGPTVRRTATISLAGTVLAALFVLAEAALENVLQTRFSGTLGAPAVAMVIAAVATALLFAPLASLAKRIARRLAPNATGDAMRLRQIEVYRHGLEAAFADGLIDATENRVLASMRRTLGITDDDHAKLLGELRARQASTA